MKNLLAFFIKYPVAVNVLMLATFIFGLMGMSNTKSSFFPLNSLKIVNISIQYPGASPGEIEEGVVLKIEDNLRGLVGVDRVTSVSRENSASIRVEGERDVDIDALLSDVKNAVDRVPSFPVDMEPPVVSKLENTNDAISFTVSGKDIDLRTIKEIARTIEGDLRGLGISQLSLKGFPSEEIEIAVRENDLRAYNLTFQEVSAAVANANILTTGGNIKTSSEEYLIRANNRSYYGKELDFLVVRADPSGNIIRLRDVADVRDRWNENPDRVYMNGDLAVKIDVKTTNNEDIVLITNMVRDYIEKFNQQYDNVQCEIALDQTVALEDRIDLLVENGGLGILLVLILLGLFLKPSIALWVAVGLPFSMFGLFIFAPQFMTINVISLFGMILVIGILVDDGIVIAENIYHHYEKGKNPIKAAIDGTLEVAPPIVSAILTTMVAFSLFFFLPGVLGDFFGEISAVLILILAISLIEAFLILPAHVSHSRALKKGSQNFLLNRWAENGMLWLRDNAYAPLLRFFLRYKMLGFSIPIALFIITMGAMQGGIIKGDFFPPIASEQVFVALNMPQGTTESVTDSLITMIEDKTWELHETLKEERNAGADVFRNTIRQIGTSQAKTDGPPGAQLGGGGGSASKGALTINLKGETERGGVTAVEVANQLSDLVGPIYGVESVEYNSGSTFGGKPVSVSLVSNNLEEIKAATDDLKSAMQAIPQLKDVADNDPQGIKEIRLRLKDNAYLLGLNFNAVMQQVRAGFFGQSVQRFQRGRDEIRVWVRYDRAERSSIKFLDEMRIVTPNRSRVPLSEIADYDIVRGEVAINHLDGKREIRVEADVKSTETTAAEMMASIQANVMPDILSKYPSVTALYEGQNREVNKLGAVMGKVMPAILLLMYVIIAFTFRSYTQPIMLFILIPFSFVGVAWGHWIHNMPVNMLSVLGIVALIGILVNDGLVLIKKFNSLLREGMPFDDALFEAGKQRFRAIFLTSITTVAGLAPLIFEPGFSAQFLIPMAISVAYGIAFATLLTLFLLPLILSVNSKVKRTTHWLKTGDWVEPRTLERAVQEMESEAMDI